MEIKIKNFKAINEIDFNFNQSLTVVGGNGSGKSTILQAIQFAVSCAQSVMYHGISPNTGGNSSGSKYPITPDQLLYSPSKELETLISFSTTSKTEIEINNGNTNKIIFTKGRNKAITTDLTDCDLETIGNLENPFSVFVPGLAGISTQEVECSYGYLKKAILYGDSNRYFRNILLKLKEKDPGSFARLNSKISSIFGIEEIRVEYNDQSDEFIDVYIRKSSKKIPIEISGTGILQVIQILGYAYLFKPKLLLLDEPDSHLHPDNQLRLLNALEELNSDLPDLHIILSTHSRHMINPNTNLLWIENGRKKISPGNTVINALMNIGALDSFRSLQEHNQKVVIISEDKDTNFLQIILDKHNVPQSMYGGILFSSKGSASEDTVHAFIQSIDHIAKEKFIVILDRDAYDTSELEHKKSRIEALGVKVIFTPGYDIEDCFCNEHAVSRFLEISIADAKVQIDSILNSNQCEIIKDWTNARRDAKLKLKQTGTDAGSVAAEATSKWSTDKRSMIKGKSLLRKINSLKATNESIKDFLIETDNVFPELIDLLSTLNN